jgi:hypothetical protein
MLRRLLTHDIKNRIVLSNKRNLGFKSTIPLLHGKDEKERVQGDGSHSNFPDFVEHWGPETFKNVGIGMTISACTLMGIYGICQETLIVDFIVGSYLYIGFKDLNQKTHALLRNFPVLGNVRFLFESIRPEIRQYFVEADEDGKPFDRNHRSLVYQRAKKVVDTICFGTRRNVYETGYEFANHSMFPAIIDKQNSRVKIGFNNPKCKQPYVASLLNISGMSYGALSDNAILALSTGAKMGMLLFLLLCQYYYVNIIMSILLCQYYYVNIIMSILLCQCYYVNVIMSILLCQYQSLSISLSQSTSSLSSSS